MDYAKNISDNLKGLLNTINDIAKNQPPEIRAEINRFNQGIINIMESDKTLEEKTEAVNKLHKEFKLKNDQGTK